MCIVSLAASAQDRTVQNRPYTDLRPFHFGVVVGMHVQDMEVLMAGPQTITTEDGTEETLVTADQSRCELRLSTHFQLRVAPMMYFGTRHIVFHDLKKLSESGLPDEKRQDMKTAYIAVAGDLIFSAPRFNNHRPYLMAGVSPMINLTGKSTDALKLKRTSLSLEFGVGCDFYLPFFKLRPELKFVYGLGNALDTNHAKELRDKSLLKFAQGVKEVRTKMVVLSFYFE